MTDGENDYLTSLIIAALFGKGNKGDNEHINKLHDESIKKILLEDSNAIITD